MSVLISPFEIFSVRRSWQLVRKIYDFQQNESLTMRGIIHFTPLHSNLLSYYEQVQYVFNGITICGSKKYFYKNISEGIEILFDDYKPFVTLKFDNRQTASDIHNCIKDQYKVNFIIRSSTEVTTYISVCGPKKSYYLESQWVASN